MLNINPQNNRKSSTTEETKLQKLEDFSLKANIHPNFPVTEELSQMNESLKNISEKEMPVVVHKIQLEGLKGEKGEAGNPGEPGKDYILTDKDKKDIAQKIEVPVVEKIIEKTEVIKEQPIVTQEIKEVAVAETAEQIRNKLESMEENEKLSIDAIKDLRKELEELKKIRNRELTPGGIIGRDLVKDIDISSSLDGMTTTFNIQSIWNVVSVNLSSYPYGSLRKNIDYTWTPTSITFTSNIDPATQLAPGQQCILTVVQS
jgi:hypothetical protein